MIWVGYIPKPCIMHTGIAFNIRLKVIRVMHMDMHTTNIIRLSEVEHVLSTGPSKEEIMNGVEILETKLLTLEEKLMRIL